MADKDVLEEIKQDTGEIKTAVSSIGDAIDRNTKAVEEMAKHNKENNLYLNKFCEDFRPFMSDVALHLRQVNVTFKYIALPIIAWALLLGGIGIVQTVLKLVDAVLK